MPQDIKKSLYDDLGLEAAGVKFDDFVQKFDSDPNVRKSIHADLGLDKAGVSYDAFEEKVGLKKKQNLQQDIPPLGQAFKLGGESTPQLPLTSQSRLGEKFDYSKNVDRANAISTDIGKINTDLAKHKKVIDFYQKDYLKNQGYNDLSTKGKTLKTELDKFDIDGFNKNLEKTKTDLVVMENKVKDYDRLVNEKNQLPESVFENYQKDLVLYKNKVNDYNTIVNDPEYQKYFKGSNELHDIYSKQNDIAKNLKTNPEYQEALAKYNEGVIKIKGGINEFNKISTDLKSYHTLKAKENYDKGLAEIKKLNPANKVALYNNTLTNINKRFNQNMLLAQQAKEQGDEATLQKLQPILDADVNKMKILEKGASAQKTIASLQEDNSLGNNLGIGMQMALGGLGTGLKGIDNAITTLQRDAFVAATGYDFTDDTKKKLDEFISKQNTSFPRGLSDEVYKISKPILEKANERSQIQDVSKKYNGSGFEALLNGDFGTAIEYGVKDFSKSLPSSLTYLTPVTAALTSGSMVGQEIDQAKDEKGIATSADVFAGMFKAGLELATERMFGAGRASRELVSRLGKTQAEKAVMDGTKEVIEKTLRQKLGRMYSEEIIGEMTNQIGSNAVDKYVHGKDVSLMDGVGNAGWIALFGAGTQGSLAETATHYIDKKATAKTEELKTQASNLMDEALHQDNPTAAEAIEKHADKLHEEAKVIEDKQQEIIDKATPETLNAIQEVNAKIEDLTASITNVSDEAKPILEQQIVELENEHKKLIKKAEKEVSESLQATPQEITTEPTSTESVEPTTISEPTIEELQQLNDIHKDLAQQHLKRYEELLKKGLRGDELLQDKELSDIKSQMDKIEKYFEKGNTTEDNGVGNASVEPTDVSEKVRETPKISQNQEEKTKETKKEIAVTSTLENSALELAKTLPESQPNTRTQATKDLIKFAEDIFNKKFEGDFEKGEYVKWLQSLGNEGYEASGMLNSPKRALAKLKESPTYQGKIKEKQPTKTNKQDEKTTNEVREVEDGQREKGNEGGKSKGKNDGQKTNDVQNEEVTEGGVKAPQVTKGSVGVGGEVESKKSEIEKLNNEIDSFDNEYNSLVDIVNKEDRRLNAPKSENEIKLNELQDKINILRDKRDKIEQSLKETTQAEEVEKTSKQAETSKEDLGYHGGNLMNKSDYLTSGYRGDMPFTGYYFFSDRNRAESRGNRSQLENNDVSVVDFSKYNLLKPTTNEYWSIKAALKKFEDRFLRGNIDDAFDSLESKYGLKDSVPKLFEQIQSNKEKIKKIAEEWKKNELENIDSKGKIERLETLILKQLGYEGVDVRGLKEQNGEASPDSSAEGSVIFDLKPDSIIESPNKIKLSEEKTKTSKPKPENVKAIEEAITKKSGTIKNEIIKEAADPTEVKKILDNLDSIKSKLAGLTTKDGDSVFSEECKWG